VGFPDNGRFRLALAGLELCRTITEAKRALDGIDKLWKFIHLGRQQLMTPAHFNREFWAAMDAIPDNLEPKSSGIAAALSMDRGTLAEYLKDAGIDFQEAKVRRRERLGKLKR
jgi:hypothetical protein